MATLRARAVDRENIALGLTNIARLELSPVSLDEALALRVPRKGAIVGTWQRDDTDPYPEVLIVADQDFSDTLAWLSSYFNGLTPITQWCRILTHSAARELSRIQSTPSVGRALGTWIGLIIAEISAQSGQALNLREITGIAALTSSSFAAARSAAVWNGRADFKLVAKRHFEISNGLRTGTRPISAGQLVPLWNAINGTTENAPLGILQGNRKAELDQFTLLLSRVQHAAANTGSSEFLVSEMANLFDLPELIECSQGPQLSRVEALDRLAVKLIAGPRSGALDALLGFGASLIEPGVAVLPELLKAYLSAMPLAPLWLGTFAGAWSPARVLADHQGLGRIISKALLAGQDLEGRPTCDIAFDELSRWLGGDNSTMASSLRGMFARSASVEILPGVTCPFAMDRGDTSQNVGSVTARSSSPARERQNRFAAASYEEGYELRVIARELARRVEALEDFIAHQKRYPDGQPNLPLRDPNGPKRTGDKKKK